MAEYDLLIIGGGAAGLTAAIYGARAGLKTVVIEKLYAGGQMVSTYDIANYPGHESIGGVELSMKMSDQAAKCGAEIVYGEITEYDLSGDVKRLKLSDGSVYEGAAAIIATGASPKKLGVKGEEKFSGKGVSYCATCDGAFYRGKRTAVVGGGNVAVEDAVYLTRFADEVFLIHRRQELRAAKAEADALAKTKTRPILDSVVVSIDGGEKVNSITVKNVKDGTERTLEVDGVFIAVGQSPMSESFRNTVRCDEGGYIVADDRMRTSVKGVFAAGDVRAKEVRQIVTACADGAIAAEFAGKYVAGGVWKD